MVQITQSNPPDPSSLPKSSTPEIQKPVEPSNILSLGFSAVKEKGGTLKAKPTTDSKGAESIDPSQVKRAVPEKSVSLEKKMAEAQNQKFSPNKLQLKQDLLEGHYQESKQTVSIETAPERQARRIGVVLQNLLALCGSEDEQVSRQAKLELSQILLNENPSITSDAIDELKSNPKLMHAILEFLPDIPVEKWQGVDSPLIGKLFPFLQDLFPIEKQSETAKFLPLFLDGIREINEKARGGESFHDLLSIEELNIVREGGFSSIETMVKSLETYYHVQRTPFLVKHEIQKLKVEDLKPEQILLLTPHQMKDLTKGQLSQLSKDQVALLTTEQLRSIASRFLDEDFKISLKLTGKQIQALTTDTIQMLKEGKGHGRQIIANCMLMSLSVSHSIGDLNISNLAKVEFLYLMKAFCSVKLPSICASYQLMAKSFFSTNVLKNLPKPMLLVFVHWPLNWSKKEIRDKNMTIDDVDMSKMSRSMFGPQRAAASTEAFARDLKVEMSWLRAVT